MAPPFDLQAITLSRGVHQERSSRVSFIEAIAWAAGEPHSDQPQCVCPVLTAFGRSWNDALPTGEERALLLKPLIPLLIGTRRSAAIEAQRAFLALDWLVRTQLPAWLNLTNSLQRYARPLFEYPEINNGVRAKAVAPLINSVREAARFAAASSSWCADWTSSDIRVRETRATDGRGPAQSAAWIIAGHVAGDALKAAAATSARSAVRDIAAEAAWDAWDAAREAAWAAAGPAALGAASQTTIISEVAAKKVAEKAATKSLHFTVTKLQLSAVDLMYQMINLS